MLLPQKKSQRLFRSRLLKKQRQNPQRNLKSLLSLLLRLPRQQLLIRQWKRQSQVFFVTCFRTRIC